MNMNGNVLIHGATMVLPNETGIGDLRIRNGVIETVALGTTLEPMDDELFVDGRNLHLLPGIIDPQVHFRDPGQPEKEDLGSGSAAAVSGGVTSFLDMPNNKPSITTLEGMRGKLKTASREVREQLRFLHRRNLRQRRRPPRSRWNTGCAVGHSGHLWH